MSSSSRVTGRGWTVLLLVMILVVVAAVAAGAFVFQRLGGSLDDLLSTESACTAEVDGQTVSLDTDQAAEAALISAVSVRRGLPARAASIALATAMQESKIRNLDYGDRDSLGVFQQRPSQGWGTPEQIMDVTYAATQFFTQAIHNEPLYPDYTAGLLAQSVQRSCCPERYDQSEGKAYEMLDEVRAEEVR